MKYTNIVHMLKTVFVADFSFPEDMAISLYTESLKNSDKLNEMKSELEEAFCDESLSWKKMLLNDEYEVMDFDTEEEAKAYAKRVLWDPIM
ncbi:hypothetical protein [Aliikangiella maris]|uniref:Uncharacterized protein n=2 Tax=Aliikangiella maris TaxID=3162458 RepID=A0ABV3MS93_9GAMM